MPIGTETERMKSSGVATRDRGGKNRSKDRGSVRTRLRGVCDPHAAFSKTEGRAFPQAMRTMGHGLNTWCLGFGVGLLSSRALEAF